MRASVHLMISFKILVLFYGVLLSFLWNCCKFRRYCVGLSCLVDVIYLEARPCCHDSFFFPALF